jgi:hypothetical protein
MKTHVKKLFLMAPMTAVLGLLPPETVLAQYTFGSEVQSTDTASITYNFGTGTFQYTDSANSTIDSASVPLTGSAAALITSSSDWHASVSVSVSAKTMTATSEETPSDGMGLSVSHLDGKDDYYVSMVAGQVNNTGNASADFPPSIYGTGAHFLARLNLENEVTTSLGASRNENGDSILALSRTTNASAATEAVGAASGVVTLDYDAKAQTVTGYYNGTPVASYSIAGWGSNPTLTLYVFGSSEEGIDVPAAADTATNFSAGAGTFSLPELDIIESGTNVVLTWPASFSGLTLQSTTNLVAPGLWTAVSPGPVVVNTNNSVTYPISGGPQFFRLVQP